MEAERLCDVHNRVKDDLCNEVIQNVKTWQKDTYHKVSVNHARDLLYTLHFLFLSANTHTHTNTMAIANYEIICITRPCT